MTEWLGCAKWNGRQWGGSSYSLFQRIIMIWRVRGKSRKPCQDRLCSGRDSNRAPAHYWQYKSPSTALGKATGSTTAHQPLRVNILAVQELINHSGWSYWQYKNPPAALGEASGSTRAHQPLWMTLLAAQEPISHTGWLDSY
jgi:hypothetical protein